jgi:hypothetical protein
MKKIKTLKLVYENCDQHILTPDMFSSLIVTGIAKEYMINCFQYKNGEVSEYITCNSIEVTITNKFVKSAVGDEIGERMRKWNDITQIVLNFEDGTSENIIVPWSGDGEINHKQEVLFRDNEFIIKIG